jgi:1-acyl-sn-glycerol-3-phosphate acyltransferase
MMPPPWVRRPLTITVWLIVSASFAALSPLLLAVAAIASRLTRRPQPLILARLVVAYFLRELATLIACAALWLASGAGALIRTRPVQQLHWRLLRWFVHGIAAPARSLLDIDVSEEPSTEAIRALEADEPLLIFSRHAGPGDTIFLFDRLISRYDRRPSVVFKEALVLDPCIDLIAHRLPHAVLDTSDRDESEARIETVSAKLDRRGALLLFPEGGNFTRERRQAALRKLRRKGQSREADRVQRMSHVLPPQPSGVLAALRGNPNAPVIFAAHTGLGLAAYPRELWRDMPVGQTLYTRMWLVSRSDIPTDPDQQVTWLNDWWKRIDQWIEQHPVEG